MESCSYIFFLVWLIDIVVYQSTTYSLYFEQYSTVKYTIYLSIHLVVDILDFFPALSCLNKAAINICLDRHVLSLLIVNIGVKWLNHMVSTCLIF